MKRFFPFILLMFIILPLQTYGQQLITFKTGFVQSKIRGDLVGYDFNQKNNINDYEWKGGLALSTSLLFRLNKYISVEPEFMYAENGFDYRRNYYNYKDSLINSELYSKKFNYFKLAVLCKFYSDAFFTLPFEKLSMFALLGSDLAVLINSVSQYKGETYPIHEAELYDFGLIFGAGAQYLLKLGLVSIEIRYNLGFIDTKYFDDLNNSFYFEDSINDKSTEAYNKSWQILFGYSIVLNR